jgi:hypothetical protein
LLRGFSGQLRPSRQQAEQLEACVRSCADNKRKAALIDEDDLDEDWDLNQDQQQQQQPCQPETQDKRLKR